MNKVGAYGYIKTSDLLPNGEWKDDAVFVISDALPEIEVRPKRND